MLKRKRVIMLMYHMVQTKCVVGKENMPWGDKKEKKEMKENKFPARLDLLLVKYKVKLE